MGIIKKNDYLGNWILFDGHWYPLIPEQFEEIECILESEPAKSENTITLRQYLNIAKNILVESKEYDSGTEIEFSQIANYCHGVSHNTMGIDRMSTNPKFEFSYDIIKWLDGSMPLSEFKLEKPLEISFNLTDEQYKSVQDTVDMFGNTKVGRSKAMRMIAVESLWRRPIKHASNVTDEQMLHYI